jgi:hypothetical protein
MLVGIIIAGLLLVATIVYLTTPIKNILPETNSGNPSETSSGTDSNSDISSGTDSNSDTSTGTSSGSSSETSPDSSSGDSSDTPSDSNPSTPADTSSSSSATVNLGTSGNFVILSKAGISTTGTTLITGDIGVSPIDQTALTGFSETMHSSNEYSTSDYVVGKLYASDYLGATPAKMTTAISNMETAYTDAAGRTNPTATELGAGDISGMTITPGLYKWGTGLMTDSSGVTLSGGANDVWIFQIGEDLTISDGAIITLSGGAQAKNIFWQVTGQTTIGTTSNFKGNILCATAIVLNTGATLNGRALSQTAVTLDANAVTKAN